MAKPKSRFGHGTGNPHPVDVHIGARVRMRRKLLGMTQTKLGDALGLTFQQVQKYERGANRIGSSRLYDLSRVFDVSIEHFFEDMPPEVAAISLAPKGRGRMKKLPSYEPNPMAKRETLELVRAYYNLKNEDVRKRLRELTRVLGTDGV